jgi:MFS transporter, FSR family, fosmidomycin resistance protein
MSLPSKPHQPSILATTLAHITVDMHTGSLPILLPLLFASFNLNYTLAASIIAANNIVIAIAQPIFGSLGDAKSYRWMVWAGCALTGLAMITVLFLPSYPLIIVAVIISGIGSAMFHPEAIARVRAMSADKVASGVSTFFSGGNIGFAIGPLLATFLSVRLGKSGELLMILPTIIALIVLATQWRVLTTGPVTAPVKKTAEPRGSPLKVAGLVSFLMLIIVLRSTTLTGLQTFIPLYYAQTSELSRESVAGFVTLFSISGVLGTLFGGVLADRFGRKITMMTSMLIALFAIYGFLHTDGFLRLVMIFMAGACLTAAWPIIIVMIQETMPNNVGLASGLSLGTAYGAQGLGVAALGLVADSWGLATVMSMLTWLPIGVLILTLFVREKAAEPKSVLS